MVHSADKNVFCYRQIRAQGNFLVDGTDSGILCILWRMDVGFPFDSIHVNASAVFFMYTGKHFDQSGFPSTVFSHQSMDFPPAQGKIHLVQCQSARKLLADPAHGQHCIALHSLLRSFQPLHGKDTL